MTARMLKILLDVVLNTTNGSIDRVATNLATETTVAATTVAATRVGQKASQMRSRPAGRGQRGPCLAERRFWHQGPDLKEADRLNKVLLVPVDGKMRLLLLPLQLQLLRASMTTVQGRRTLRRLRLVTLKNTVSKHGTVPPPPLPRCSTVDLSCTSAIIGCYYSFVGGGTGTAGTSGGVSAVHNTGYKRLHPHNPHRARGGGQGNGGVEGSGGSGSGGTDGSGVSGSGSGGATGYKAPLLTEELLLVHNRGMEQKMIEHYKVRTTACQLMLMHSWMLTSVLPFLLQKVSSFLFQQTRSDLYYCIYNGLLSHLNYGAGYQGEG